jgi:hypothetical protein
MTLRDPAQTEEGYRNTIAQFTRDLEETVGRGVPRILFRTPPKCCGIAMAHYSAGDPVLESLHWFNEAVNYRLAYHEGVGYRISSMPFFEASFQLLGAAHFVHRAPELVASFRRCEFAEAPRPWELELTRLAWAVFSNEPWPTDSSAEALIKKHAKQLFTAVPLLEATARGDKVRFSSALLDYFEQSWSKLLRGEKPGPQYSGLWNIGAGALCQKIGVHPEFPESIMRYISEDMIAGSD